MWSSYPVSSVEPFGLGLSSSLEAAGELCERKRRGDPRLAALGCLNLGVSSAAQVPADLIYQLAQSELRAVVHLEEFNLVDPELDSARLAAVTDRLAPLRPEWVQQDVGLWLHGHAPLFGHMMNAIQDEANVETISSNIRQIMQTTGRLFLAENAPAYMSVEDRDLLTFMSQLATRSDCGLILDIGHFIGYCIATDRDPVDYVSAWDGGDRVLEVHVAGFEVHRTPEGLMWLDDHSLPIPRAGLEVLAAAVGRAKNLKVVVLEQEGAPPSTIDRNLAAVADAVGIG